MILAKNITRTQAEKLKKKKLCGRVVSAKLYSRNYPEGELGAHVLGFVNAAGEGQYGVEGSLNKRLKGRDGLLQSVTDVKYTFDGREK